METLLQRIVEIGADVAIIDITGVPIVDTHVARALLHVAETKYRLHEAEGDAAHEIVRLARELASELIVMGTRGLGAVHHALIGSVALKVAQASPVPMVLVP